MEGGEDRAGVRANENHGCQGEWTSLCCRLLIDHAIVSISSCCYSMIMRGFSVIIESYLWQINTCAVPEEEEEVISDVLVQHKHSMDFIEKASEHPNKVC